MQTNSRFWDKIADKYAKHPIKDQAAYAHKLEKTCEYFGTQSKVLEFGCGTGSTALLHAPKVAFYKAIDISTRMIEIAQTKPRLAGTNALRFEVASLESLDVESAENNGVDVILGLSILHLLDDAPSAMNKVSQLLKPNGVFITSTVCLGDGHNYLKPIMWPLRLIGKVPKVTFFKQTELEALLTQAGFVIEYRWTHGKMPTAFLVARKSIV